MVRIIFNADDFGYSEAVTLGIIKAHKDGVIVSTTMMSNMPAAAFAAKLSRDYPKLYIGQHSNIVIGKPVSDPALLPSLVDENGYFNTKARKKRGESLNKEEIKLEVRAQAERFKELMGHYPSHIEGHAISDPGLFYAISTVATELGVHYTDIERDGKGGVIRGANNYGYELPDYPDAHYYMEGVSLDFWLRDLGHMLEKDLVEMHTHPGYIDQELLDWSSYNLYRAKEVQIACSKELKDWIKANGVQMIGFDDVKKV